MVPDRAGAATHADVHIALAELLTIEGATGITATWLAAIAGQPGYLTGKDAETAACDALIVPVVTGHPDLTVVDKMIAIVAAYLDDHQATRPTVTPWRTRPTPTPRRTAPRTAAPRTAAPRTPALPPGPRP